MSTPKKILIVDDEVNFTKMVSAFFEDSGYKIDIANSGLEALKCNRQSRYDLILLDLNMPDFDGVHVAKVTRENRPGTKIIVITGYVDEFEKELQDLKVEFIMQKPIGMNDLAEKITTLLGAPSAELVKKVSRTGTPKAKLLFIEHDDIAFTNLFAPYFREISISGSAKYEIALAEDRQRALDMARMFRPDIVLLNTDMLEIYKDLMLELHSIVALPKEVIIHGKELYNKSPEDLGFDRDGVTAIEGGFYDMDYPRRLEEAVREIAYVRGLLV